VTRSSAAFRRKRPNAVRVCPASAAQSTEAPASRSSPTVAENRSGLAWGSKGRGTRRVRTAAPQARTSKAPTGFASVAPAPSDPGRCAGNVSTVKAATARGSLAMATTTNAAPSIASTAVLGE